MPGDAGRLDPVIVEALKQLRSFTYRRHRPRRPRHFTYPRPAPFEVEGREKNLSDPAARAGAIHIFKHLKHHGYAWNPDDVHAWAITHDFTPEDANRLAEYARGVQAGTRYHTQPDPFGQLAIAEWQKNAEQPGTGRRWRWSDTGE